jgi:hypothetical protein
MGESVRITNAGQSNGKGPLWMIVIVFGILFLSLVAWSCTNRAQLEQEANIELAKKAMSDGRLADAELYLNRVPPDSPLWAQKGADLMVEIIRQKELAAKQKATTKAELEKYYRSEIEKAKESLARGDIVGARKHLMPIPTGTKLWKEEGQRLMDAVYSQELEIREREMREAEEKKTSERRKRWSESGQQDNKSSYYADGAGRMDGSSWNSMTRSEKERHLANVMSNLRSKGRKVNRNIDWFIRQLDYFYSDRGTNSVGFAEALAAIGIVEGALE